MHCIQYNETDCNIRHLLHSPLFLCSSLLCWHCACAVRDRASVWGLRYYSYVFVYLSMPNLLHSLRRLKLHGQNVPKTASPQHSEKIVLLGDPQTQEPKIQQKAINWSIFIYFRENRLPGKIIYLPKNALLFSENHYFLIPLPLMLSYENTHELPIFSKTGFRKPC